MSGSGDQNIVRRGASVAFFTVAVPTIAVAITELPMATDRPVRALDLPSQPARWVVFFGYVDCPSVCPATMTTLRDAYRRLDGSQDVGVAFIDLDGAAPDAVGRYAAHFHPDFIGRSAGPDARKALHEELGVRFERSASGPQAYHTDAIYLLARSEGALRLRGMVRGRGIGPARLAQLIEGIQP